MHEAPDGGVVILAEAPMIAAYALEDARLAALHHAVGAPFGSTAATDDGASYALVLQ